MKILRLLATLFACSVPMCITTAADAVGGSGQGTWKTTLQGRDLDGNTVTFEAYYDTTLDITWLADTNAAAGSVYDTFSPGSGRLTWADAKAWTASLDINGVNGWRLPSVSPISGSSFNTTSSSDGTTGTQAIYCGKPQVIAL